MKWVITKYENWRDYYESNYEEGLKSITDCGVVSGMLLILNALQKDPELFPHLQQAVESNVAELEEATFGRGKFFDIADDVVDTAPRCYVLAAKARRNFESCKIRKAVAEC